LFISKGYDCIHTLDLELKNETSDKDINLLSINQQRILITKDSDFFDSFILKRQPYKLILVKCGNTSKNELLQLFSERFDEIIQKINNENMILFTKD
jgi:predicted nuclease of predicted toxin-antitoxin system